MVAIPRLLADLARGPEWTTRDGSRNWLARLLRPALDTPLWLALAVFVAMVVALAQAVYLNAKDDRFVSLAVLCVLGGLALVQYASRIVVVLRLSRQS